jgi:hypothetical protein
MLWDIRERECGGKLSIGFTVVEVLMHPKPLLRIRTVHQNREDEEGKIRRIFEPLQGGKMPDGKE